MCKSFVLQTADLHTKKKKKEQIHNKSYGCTINMNMIFN